MLSNKMGLSTPFVPTPANVGDWLTDSVSGERQWDCDGTAAGLQIPSGSANQRFR